MKEQLLLQFNQALRNIGIDPRKVDCGVLSNFTKEQLPQFILWLNSVNGLSDWEKSVYAHIIEVTLMLASSDELRELIQELEENCQTFEEEKHVKTR